MTALKWDQVSERTYETGVDHGVLYIPNNAGAYNDGVAWNGLVSVTESPSGAESNKQYADNRVYVNLVSAEEFGGTLEAFTYPDEFAQCDGSAFPTPGVSIGQQPRKSFGLSYRTLLGNDVEGTAYGYKLHLVYGAMASPSERAYQTVNDSPEAVTFSWALSTTPVDVADHSPTAVLTIDSTKVSAVALQQLEDVLYGTPGVDPALPKPDAVIAILEGSVTEATPVAPTYNSTTDTITIPTTTGVVYKINGEVVTGAVVITEDTVVTAEPAEGYIFTSPVDDDWFFDFT